MATSASMINVHGCTCLSPDTKEFLVQVSASSCNMEARIMLLPSFAPPVPSTAPQYIYLDYIHRTPTAGLRRAHKAPPVRLHPWILSSSQTDLDPSTIPT